MFIPLYMLNAPSLEESQGKVKASTCSSSSYAEMCPSRGMWGQNMHMQGRNIPKGVEIQRKSKVALKFHPPSYMKCAHQVLKLTLHYKQNDKNSKG